MSRPPGENTLTFDEFWRWLKKHANCILRAGTPDAYLYDHESLHWHLDQEPGGNPVIQLVWGKVLMAEMMMDTHDIMYVQISPDEDDQQSGQHLFELVGGNEDEVYPVYHFVLAHGYDEERSHAVGIQH